MLCFHKYFLMSLVIFFFDFQITQKHAALFSKTWFSKIILFLLLSNSSAKIINILSRIQFPFWTYWGFFFFGKFLSICTNLITVYMQNSDSIFTHLLLCYERPSWSIWVTQFKLFIFLLNVFSVCSKNY